MFELFRVAEWGPVEQQSTQINPQHGLKLMAYPCLVAIKHLFVSSCAFARMQVGAAIPVRTMFPELRS